MELIRSDENRCNFHRARRAAMFDVVRVCAGGIRASEKGRGKGREINFTVGALLFVWLNEVYRLKADC